MYFLVLLFKVWEIMTPKELKKLRAELDITQQELADALDVKVITINRWENHPQNKIPEDKQRLLDCFYELISKAADSKENFSVQEIKDAIKHTGIKGVVFTAVIAGVLTGGLATAKDVGGVCRRGRGGGWAGGSGNEGDTVRREQ